MRLMALIALFFVVGMPFRELIFRSYQNIFDTASEMLIERMNIYILIEILFSS